MDSFDKWFSRFMWGTDIVFLVASMPHIAAWFAHFDNPTDFLSGIYAWTVGFALAVAIDGVSFMLLLAITRMIKQGKTKSWWVVGGLLLFMAFIAAISWDINYQYDVQFASDAFAKADSIKILGTTMGQLNPIMGGAFQVLILAYALIGKAMQSEVKTVKAMSDEEFETQKRAIQQRKTLKDLGKNDDDQGLFAKGKERLLGKGKDEELEYIGRLNTTVDYLRDATELLDLSQSQKAIEILMALLKVNQKQAEVFLVQARSKIAREKEEWEAQKQQANRPQNEPSFEEETPQKPARNPQRKPDVSQQESGENLALDPETIALISQYPDAAQLLDTSASTILIADVASMFNCTPTLIKNRANDGDLSYVKGKKSVYKISVIKWAKSEMMGKGKRKVINLDSARNSQEKSEGIRQEKVSG